jgi:carbamoyltransferase
MCWTACLGPALDQHAIERRLAKASARYKTLDRDALVQTRAQALADGNAIGWFQGRMEFGPRALGSRSIIADPRNTTMQNNLNLEVKYKYRERFRPFAPSVLRDHLADCRRRQPLHAARCRRRRGA